MAKKAYRKYSHEFRKQAVQLSYELGPARAAKQLGISGSNMSNWRSQQSKEKSVTKVEEVLSQEQELKRLRKEVEEQKKVIHILRRAAAFFSQDHLK